MEDLAYRKIVPVTALPTASATYTGVLAHRSSDDTLHWCDGSSWIELSQTSKTGVYRTLYIPAGAMTPRETNGAEASTEEYATNDVVVDQYLFDAVTEEGVQFQIAMPDAWDRSTLKAKFYWVAPAGSSASDGVTWGIAARAVSDDGGVDGAFPSSVDVDDTVIAVDDLHITAATAAVTVSGTPALGDLVLVEITRVVDDANDDMSEDAKLAGVAIPRKWGQTTFSLSPFPRKWGQTTFSLSPFQLGFSQERAHASTSPNCCRRLSDARHTTWHRPDGNLLRRRGQAVLFGETRRVGRDGLGRCPCLRIDDQSRTFVDDAGI